jgi:hypothetical protein
MSKNHLFSSPLGIGLGIGIGTALGGIAIGVIFITAFKYIKRKGKGVEADDVGKGVEADDVGKGVSDDGSVDNDESVNDDGSVDDDESVDNRGSSFFDLNSAFEDTNRDSVKSTYKPDDSNDLTSLRREFKPKQGPYPNKRVKGGKHSKKNKRKGKCKRKSKSKRICERKNKFRTLKKV